MRSYFETEFEKNIISSIMNEDCSSQERAEKFLEFHHNSSTYYEELCDALFFLSTGEKKGTLYITLSGRPYISKSPQQEGDRKLFTHDSLPSFHDDLYDQLLFFFRNYQRVAFPVENKVS